MNVLITSGGTTEQIDAVRAIQNTSSGRLGAALAEEFGSRPEAERIFYVCAKNAARPAPSDKIQVVEYKSVADLEQAVRSVCEENKVHAVVHAAAVSDYRVRRAATIGDIGRDLRADFAGGKLPSTIEGLVLVMERTPKIIAQLRPLLPEAVIVGFKLLDSVPRENLIGTARKLMEKNGCDFVLANDLARITEESHEGILLGSDGSQKEFGTKEEIAAGIADAVLGRQRA